MSSLKSYLDQYEAETAAIGGGSSNTPAPSVNYLPPVQAKPKDVGGFVAAGKRAVGAGLQGVGQLAADFVPGVGQDNALTTYGKGVVEANAPAITSLGDIAERPGMALKEATGNVAGSVGTALGLRALGQGITAASPLTGLFAPVTAAVGQGISWGSPILAGMLPSFGGIREQQIAKDAGAATSTGEKLTALGGAAAVGALEKFGPEGWATAALNKDARKALVSKFSGAGTLQRMGMAGAKGAAIEGATEMVQNPIEQWASGDNPLSAAALKDTLFAGAMGAIGGGTVGSAFGMIRDKPAGQVTNDDLKGATDEQLAPPAAPAEPLADEYSRMQREFEVANQPQGNRYPELAESSVEQLQRMEAYLGSKAGKSTENAKEIKAAIAEELQARAKAAEPTLAQQNDAKIAQAWGRPEFALEPSPVGDVQRAPELAPEGITSATDLTATLPLFDEAGRVSPEIMVAERAGRARPAQDMTADEVAARLQEAVAPRAAGGQAELMAGQLPAPSLIVTAPGGGAPVPAASLKGLPVAAKTELSKHLGNPEQLAAAVADMFYTKAGAGSSASYVFDKLPALYQQVTGQPLPETPAAAPAPIAPSAIGAQGAEFLQGETPEQAAANFARRQELEALAQPLPVVQQPRGKQQSTFIDQQGEVDLIQPGMSRRESAAQRRAREFAARNKAARQKVVAETLGQNIPKVPNAVQEPISAEVDVRQPAQAGKQVAKGNAQGTPAAAKGQVQAKAAVTPIRGKGVVAQGDQDSAVLAAMSQMSQEEEAERTPEQEIIDTLENNFDMDLSKDDRTMLTARLTRAKTQKEKDALATKFMEQAVKNKRAAEKPDGKTATVVEQGRKGAGDNAAAGAGTGRAEPGNAAGAVRGRAGTSGAGNASPVAVGDTGSQQPARVAPEGKVAAITKGYAFKDLRDAYLESKSGAAGAEARMIELTGIAEIEQIGGTKQQREQAKAFLDSASVNPKEAATARRQAQDAVGRVAAQEKRQTERDKAAAARQKALDKQLKEMLKAEGGEGLSALERKIRNARKKDKSKDRKQRGISPAIAALWDAKMAELDSMARKAGVKPADVAEMKGEASGTATTKVNPNVHTMRSLAEELVKTFGEDMRDAILIGRVKLVADQTHLVAVTGDMSRRGQITQGMYYYDPKASPGRGTVYFIAGNLAKTQQGYTAFDVALHEIGEHAGMQQMLGSQTYAQLMSSIRKSMALETPKTQFDKDVAAAKKKLMADQQGQPHEVLAYMIQHTPDSTGLQKMWAAIKAFAARFGLLPESMNDAATMRALAEGAAAKWLKGVAGQAAARGMTGQASGQTQWDMTRAALQQVENGRLTLDGEYGFDTMTRLLDEARTLQVDYPDSTVVELYKDLGGTGVVYGAGGYNRYGLRADGQLAPIESSFTNKEKLQQARAALSQAQNVTGAASGVNNPEMRKVFTNFGEAATAAKQVLGKVEGMKGVEWQNKRLGAFKLMSSWITKHHMVTQFDKWFKGALKKNAEADTIQQATSARTAQLFNEPYNRLKALPQEIQSKVAQLMELTEMKLDPRKLWDAHTHLHGLKGADLAQVKEYHNKARQWWGQLGATANGKIAQEVYSDLAAMNEALYTMELAVSTYNMVHANAGPAKDLAVFKTDPTEKFRQSAAVHGSIEAAHTYWKGVLNGYTDVLDKYVAEQRGLLPKKSQADPEVLAAERKMLKGVQNEKVRRTIRAQLRTRTEKLSEEQKKIVRHLSPLEAQLRMTGETTETFKHAPYFHLGRFGDQFVSFRVRADEEGQADPKAMAHVQQVLAEEFKDVAIRTDATDPHVFARFESVDQAAAFEERARKLQAEGWLMQPGVKDEANKDIGLIRRGKRQEIIAGYHTAGPNWLSRVVESIQAEGFDDDITKQMVAHVRSMYLDSLPDTAAIKVKQRREGRPGWHRDMMRNYAHRMRVGSNRVASLAAEPTRTQSFAEMNDVLAQSETDPNISTLQHNKMAVLVDELQKRNSDQMSVPHTPGVDMLRALNHAYFLGMSPSYLLIQMTQLGVLTWPELAKKHGYVKAAKALGEVAGIAFKVVGAVLREGYKSRGIAGAADMVITGDILEKAGLTKSDAEFLVKIMAAGKLDIGNAARNVGRVAEGETGSEALKIATSMGYASEVLTRTITALAAKRLHKGDNPEQYAINVIDEAMLDYTIENEGRMMGKQGVIGAASPVMFSFMKYQAQLLEKMYREVYSAYSKDATEEQKAEARKFLGGHLASMMVLAGTLGLPFATVVAAAADKLCEMFGEGHCDSKTAMRNMTAEVFGHDIEPLLSRGLIRGAGIDISERAGEGNLLPFSKFLADKRAMDDKLKALAMESWGAPTSMIANMLKANEKIWQGDLLGAMQEGVPLALKGPLKAYEMSEKGYTDKAGNVLPMTPGAYDMLLQSIGLNPGEKADYQQAKFAQSQRTGVLGREATTIRNKLASAIEQNDTDAMQKWMEKAQAYDTENAGSRAILPQMGSVLQQRARARAIAASGNTTLGVSPRDFEAQRFTSFYRTE